jgi:hypothetical protein
MLRNLGVALFVITAVLISRASAGTQFFTAQLDFNNAVSLLNHGPVGPLAGPVTEIDVFTTGTTNGFPFFDCCISPLPPPSFGIPKPVQFNAYSLDLAAFGEAIDAHCFGVPNCTATALTGNNFVLPSIWGFSAALASTGAFGGPPAMINGDVVPINVTNGFFGVLFSNPTTMLDFAPSDVLSDFSPNIFSLSTGDVINVVFADEPSALGCLLAALMIFSIALVRFGRSQTR